MLSAPTRMAPAASSRSTKVASCVAGGRSRLIVEPASVDNPATSNRFLTAKGTPASGPSARPSARSASIARALARARSSVTAVKQLRTGSRTPIAASADSTTASALTSPALTARAVSAADAYAASKLTASCLEHRRRLGVIRQSEIADERRLAQDDPEVGLDRGPPLRLDWQVERRCRRRDEIVERIARQRLDRPALDRAVSAHARL